MRITTLSILLLAVPVVAFAQEPRETRPRDTMTEVLRERAERPAASPDAAALGGTGTLLFSLAAPDNAPCVRGLPDLDGDGRSEVLVGIDESQTENVFVLDGASGPGPATVRWSLETMDGVSGGSPYGDQSLVAASDADGNGHSNVLVGTAWGGRTAYSLDTLDGTVHWKFDTYLTAASGWVYSLAEIDDVTGDGVPEVAFGVGSDSNSLYLVDGASSGGGQATVVWRYAAADAVLSVRDLGDVNGDGDHDVVAAIGDFGRKIVCLDGGTASPAGHVLWEVSTAPSSAYAVGVLEDVNGDGVSEALAVVWTPNGSAVRCLDGATGALLWASTDIFDFGVMVDALEDVDGDGIAEVIVSSFENAVHVLSGADGTRIWRTAVHTTHGGDVWSARAIADLNGDGHEDVVAGSFDTHVYALDGRDGGILWNYGTGNRVFSVHPVGDLTGDGRPEVAVGTQDTSSSVVLYVLDGAAGLPVFADGFESGGTGAWSATVP